MARRWAYMYAMLMDKCKINKNQTPESTEIVRRHTRLLRPMRACPGPKYHSDPIRSEKQSECFCLD